MPNTPLQTFRTVEPANYAFGSSATLASRPFVLYHQRGTEVSTQSGATTSVSYPSFTGVLDASRFQPWTVRSQNQHYPVMIPNAYDRVFIYPMYVLDTTNGQTGATGSTTPVSVGSSIAAPSTYTAPWIAPFGRFSESKDGAISVNSGHRQLPWDVIRKVNPNAVITPDPSTAGCWTLLSPYASNFTTSSGILTAAATVSNQISHLRAMAGIGNAYQLPPDLTVGLSADTVSEVGNGNSRFAATTTSMIFNGAGIEYTTAGCEELVVSLIKAPANLPAVTLDTMSVSGTGAVQGKAALNFFLMGVFLG